MAFAQKLLLLRSRLSSLQMRGISLVPSSMLSFTILLGLVSLPASAINQRLVDKLIHFSSPDSELQHFSMHKGTGEIYLGGTDKLYYLSPNLDKLSEVDTREEGMTEFCPTVNANSCPHDSNVNRVLQVDYERDLIVSCGSAFFGTCALHDLNNFTRVVGWPAFVTGREDSSREDSLSLGETVVGFYALFQAGTTAPEEQVLYVGGTFNSDPQYTNVSQHAVTAKKLEEKSPGEWHFSFAYQESTYSRNPFINVKDTYKNSYKIKYIYGFNSGGFNYFTTVQRENVDVNEYHSRIVRICKRDKSFFSYTEMKLHCRSRNSNEDPYNILSAAYIGKAGSNLQKFNEGEDVLFGVFSRSVSEESDQPGHDSALCLYSIRYINRQFKKGLQDCFHGEPQTQGLKFLSEDRSCSEATYKVVTDDFCGTSDLQPVEARRPANVQDQLRGGGSGKLFTSISAMPMGGDTVALIGTQDGHVMKFLLQSKELETEEANFWARKPYKDLDLSDSPVLPDMAFDAAKEHVYVMTSHEIFKIVISTCDHYVDCSACITTHDPKNCGWCGYCSTQAECSEQGGSPTWQRANCPPAIYGVTPLAGPLEGNTQVTITGDNLGQNVAESNTHEVTVAGEPCTVIPDMSEIYRIVCITSPVTAPTKGPIIAEIEVYDSSNMYMVNGTISSEPDFIFTYVDPVITAVQPNCSVMSGGTLLNITGNGLNAGNNITVSVAGQPCLVKSIRNIFLTCVTEATTTLGDGDVEIQLDSKRISKSRFFTYVEDPVVERFSPNKAIISGGQTISAFGKNFQCVHEAKIEITILPKGKGSAEMPGSKYTTECNLITNDHVECPSPNISQSSSGVSSDQPIRASVTFFLDNKPAVVYNSNASEFLFYLDPVFNLFGGDDRVINITEGDSLTIKGDNLNLALTESDIHLTIGGIECKEIDLQVDEITCEIPDLSEAVKDSLGYKVEIQTGNIRTVVGYTNIIPGPFPWYAILIVILLVLCVIVLIILVRVRKQAQKDIVVDRLAGPVLTPSIMFRQTSSTGGESAEARVIPPAFTRINNYMMRTPSSSAEAAFAGIPDENRPLLETISKDLAMQVSGVLINEDNLKRGEVIGQGHFGCVYQGKLWQDGTSFPVAVKSLIRGGADDITNFMREGIMMIDFKHPHVLQLIGVCIDCNNMPLVVLPFMTNGDLLTYVRDSTKELTARDLLEFSRQVADGMAYLSELKFVHRDLAARNCMLDDGLLVKIADFGLSRDIYERDYYCAKDKSAKLPVRWMALECLERSVYNTKTDVWSFGVVMWELLTRGMSPYPAVDNWDINTYLQRGRRLQQPMHCPDHVYQIMMNCWSVSPVDRPTFEMLVCQLTDILSAPADKQTPEDLIYLNVVPQIN